MKTSRGKHIITAIIIILLSACTADLISPVSETDIAVVEAFLEPGADISVYLTKMFEYVEDSQSKLTTIDSVVVFITFNGKEFKLIHSPDKPGLYSSMDSALIAEPEGVYELLFTYNGTEVTATTTIPTKPTGTGLSTSVLHVDPNVRGPGSVIEPMTVTWANEFNVYHQIVLEYMDSTYTPIGESLDPDRYDEFKKVATEPVVGTSFDLNTREHLVFFGNYRIILYKVNDEYVDLYENIGQSSLNLTQPLTNIENGLGIFTAVNSDTLYLVVKSI